MWHTKHRPSLASSAATAASTAPNNDGDICWRSTVIPDDPPNHHHLSAPAFESSPYLQQQLVQQHHPAKMVNRLKSLVSKKKKRFQEDGFDLDLSYISSRIIAMGFPAERIEGFYRNHIDEVSRFFETRHKGHYKIYHLCNERDFNEYRFSGPVVRYPFSDHNAPQFSQVVALCQDVLQFLKQHPDNIVAINCKAGKGRTGVMVCACLMELQEAGNAEEALRLYAEKRTRNGQGVTIPSQRRYVQYYSRLLSSNLIYEPTPLRLTSIRIEGLSHQLHGVQNFELSISTYENQLPVNHNHDPTLVERVNHSLYDYATFATTSTIVAATNSATAGMAENSLDHDCHRQLGVATYQIPCSTHHNENGSYLIRLDEPVTIFEDFRIKIKAKTGVLTKKIGQCWLNTFFVLLDDDTATNASTNSNFFMSDSNSGSGSSSESSTSTTSSTSSSLRNSPPHFAGVSEEEDEEELPTLTSSSTLPHPVSPSAFPASTSSDPTDPAVVMRRSLNPLRVVPSKAKNDTGSAFDEGIIKRSSSGTNSTPPWAVRVLELPHSDLDSTTKSIGKKAEGFKVLFEFIREVPCFQSSPTYNSANFSNAITACPVQSLAAMELEGAEDVIEVEELVENAVTSFPHHHPFHSPVESKADHADALVS